MILKQISKVGFLLLVLISASCSKHQSRFDVNPGNLDMNSITIHRYGRALFEINRDSLGEQLRQLQPEFEIFLGNDLDNPVNLQRIDAFISDTMLQNVYKDCMKKYPDLTSLQDQLYDAFRYYHYYFPDRPIPEVYTYISGFDYEHKVQFYDNKLLIALDMFLGKDYSRYKHLGLPAYVIDEFTKENLPSDCMLEIAKSFIDVRKTGDELIDRMILEGKLHWFIHAMIPGISDEILFDYNADQLEWIRKNEGLVWGFIVENEMLYGTDPLVRQKFLADNPFTSYFGQDSPPRLGTYIGYRMVNEYMERNRKVSLKQLMQTYDAAEILKGSRYKPKI